MASLTATSTHASKVAQFYALTKPRVVQLIIFCALIGMLLASQAGPAVAVGGRRGHLVGGWRGSGVQLHR
jgi:heme O synthase-like polyprenyltransferase